MRQMMVFAVWRCAKGQNGHGLGATLTPLFHAYTDETTNTSRPTDIFLRGNAGNQHQRRVARLKSGTVDHFHRNEWWSLHSRRADACGGKFAALRQMAAGGSTSIRTRATLPRQTFTATGGTGMIIGVRQQRPTLVTRTADNCFDLYGVGSVEGYLH